MAIPKTIHYCWFGKKTKPASVQRCIKSWRRICKDYQIIEWNEDNLDLSAFPQFVQDAYRAEKWAFVTDFVRLHLVYTHGGIYLDTDVEFVKSPAPLLNHRAYFGFESGRCVNTGLGFGAEKGLPILLELMEPYYSMQFDDSEERISGLLCPQLNTNVLLEHGLRLNDQRQILEGDILILPTVCLCPLEYSTRILRKTRETYSIHWFHGSWTSQQEKERYKREVKEERLIRLRVAFTDMLKERLGDRYYAVRDVWRHLCQRK